MAFSNAVYVVSAPDKKTWPVSKLPEVLLIGRSNVGKSSVINAIFNNKRLAHVGKTPGKTRLLNFFETKEMMFVDSPGYGYANRSKEEQRFFQRMMEEYLYERENLKFIIWILDIRRLPNVDDLMMHKWLLNSKHGYLIILNKADKLSNNQQNNQIRLIREALQIERERLLPFSAKTSMGKEKLLEKIENISYN